MRIGEKRSRSGKRLLNLLREEGKTGKELYDLKRKKDRNRSRYHGGRDRRDDEETEQEIMTGP